MPETYTLLSGEEISFPPPRKEVTAFVNAVRLAVADPTVSSNDLINLIYGPENPLLKHGVIPGRGLVTKDVFENPVHHMILDLLAQKQIQEGTLDIDAAHSTYTVSVPEAAEQLGISESAIRQAIKAKKLSAIKRGSQWKIHANSIASYEVSRRGPQGGAELSICVGSLDGHGLDIAHDGDLLWDQRPGGLVEGTITNWTRAAIRTRVRLEDGSDVRFFEIAPSRGREQIGAGQLYVHGPFKITSKINNTKRAVAAWKSARRELV